MKKALILDLDNTIYPVNSIADHLFVELFSILDENAEELNSVDKDNVEKIKEEMTRRPFQHIAEKYELDKGLREKMEEALRTMTYDLPMSPFEDYTHLRSVQLDKILVTTGYPKLQWSKVKQLDIEADFKEIFVVDPDAGNQTKKDIFALIMEKYDCRLEDLLIIGDDPESEIKAALALGIDTFLFDPDDIYAAAFSTHRSRSLREVLNILI